MPACLEFKIVAAIELSVVCASVRLRLGFNLLYIEGFLEQLDIIVHHEGTVSRPPDHGL